MNTQLKKPNNINQVKHSTYDVATSPVMVGLARLGYAAKGMVYLVIGFLAVLLVTGKGGQITDQNGALKAIYGSPLGEGFGRILMILATVGLFGFALWSLIQALFDTEGKGHDAGGIVARVGYAIVAIPYTLLGVVAYQIALSGSSNTSSRNSTTSTQNWTGLLLKQPGGVLLVILVGIVVLGVAAYLLYKAYRARFALRLNLSTLNAQARKGIINAGRFGYAALGVVFTVIGIFLVVAAMKHNPHDAKGLDSALIELLKQPFGPWLLGIVALGLIAYGVYSLMEARYRRVGK